MTALPDDDAATPATPAEGAGPVVPVPRRRRRWVVVVVVLVALVVGGIAVGVALAFSRGAISTAGEVEFTRPLAIPPLAGSSLEDGVRVFSLDLQEGETDLGQGRRTPTLGVNGTFLGPTLRAARGERVRIDVTNSMSETSTLHWHGMQLPAVMDGGPHQPVDPGQTWSPDLDDRPAGGDALVPPAPARTDGRPRLPRPGRAVHRRRARGVAEAAVQAALPHRYGVDDVPLDGPGQEVPPRRPAGRRRPVLVEHGHARRRWSWSTGRRTPTSTSRPSGSGCGCSTGPTRASTTSGSPTAGSSRWSAPDGGLLDAPVTTDRLQLSPGERAEIVVSLAPGERPVLRSFPPELGANASPPLRGRGRHPRRAGAARGRAAHALGARAREPGDPPRRGRCDREQHAHVSSCPAPRSTARTWTCAGSTRSSTPARPRSGRSRASTARRTISTSTMSSSRCSTSRARRRPLELEGWKEHRLRPPRRITRLIMTFGDHARPEHPYMFHCHMLRHEDQGMMGQFVVVDPAAGPGTAGRPDPGDVLPGVSDDVGHEEGHASPPDDAHARRDRAAAPALPGRWGHRGCGTPRLRSDAVRTPVPVRGRDTPRTRRARRTHRVPCGHDEPRPPRELSAAPPDRPAGGRAHLPGPDPHRHLELR